MLDYIRVACAVPPVRVGDVKKNTEDICRQMGEADAKSCDVIVFPELALTGYTCADLFTQKSLLDAVKSGLRQIVSCSADHPELTAVVGLPVMIDAQLYNCAAVITAGEVRGLVPKTYLPDYGEFREKRWFASGADLIREYISAQELGLDGWYSLNVNPKQIFCLAEGAMLGVEICEDLWAPIPVSSELALGGAELIVNLAASNETMFKRAQRKRRVQQQSEDLCCIYAFCSAGETESTQDLVFSGHSMIAQDGTMLAENEKLIDSDYLLIMDADLGVIRTKRNKVNTFRDAAAGYAIQRGNRPGEAFLKQLRGDGSYAVANKLPFVPATKADRLEQCKAVFQVQAAGLKQRLAAIGAKAVIGISGGLDSTLALLVTVEAMRQLGRPASDIHGITMPCFGTSDRTYNNAWALMKKLGISCKEINIRDAVTGHLKDIGHDIHDHNAVYENAQARERTQILMDYAGEVGGIVIGTGDLSELALGWCTYNGDHMSMYSVNASIPKTLIRWIIEAIADEPVFAEAKDVLMDVLDTPISPELLPPDEKGRISQQTEDIVGPYALHDFFLYYTVHCGFTPQKLYTLACRTFADDFDETTVKKWLQVFYRRFFTQQFKRNCQPDGVKAGVLSLSPRGDWQMPSDAAARLWLEEAENL